MYSLIIILTICIKLLWSTNSADLSTKIFNYWVNFESNWNDCFLIKAMFSSSTSIFKKIL